MNNNNGANGSGLVAALKSLFKHKVARFGPSQSGKVLRYSTPGQEHVILIAPARVSLKGPLLLRRLDMPDDDEILGDAWRNDSTGNSYDE